ncbi:MAG: hypothetical protein RLZZ584_280 [Pseudomonadota bacterium]|jgi:hypothetical protein
MQATTTTTTVAAARITTLGARTLHDIRLDLAQDRKSDRTFATTLLAMLLALLALPFTPALDAQADDGTSPARIGQAAHEIPLLPALETVVITRQRPLQQAQAASTHGAAAAPRS